MEFAELVRRRRMVRRYDPTRPVPDDALDAVLAAALRAPSAGYTQGVSLLVLQEPEDREAFWSATAEVASAWLEGMRGAPVLILVWTSERAYLDRYAEPDKGWTDRDPGRWAAPYWYVDAGMSALAALFGAVDRELGACFFGVPADRQAAVRARLDVPPDQLSVGVISLGYPTGPQPEGSAAHRPRKSGAERVHRGRWRSGPGGLSTPVDS
jgi:nitroreductase